jgi:hypothetical protein
VNSVDQVPVGILHVLEANVAQDTSIVEEDINTTEVLNSGLDDGFAVLDTVVVGDRLAAGGPDLFDDIICSLCTVSLCRCSGREINIPCLTCPHPCESRRGH